MTHKDDSAIELAAEALEKVVAGVRRDTASKRPTGLPSAQIGSFDGKGNDVVTEEIVFAMGPVTG